MRGLLVGFGGRAAFIVASFAAGGPGAGVGLFGVGVVAWSTVSELIVVVIDVSTAAFMHFAHECVRVLSFGNLASSGRAAVFEGKGIRKGLLLGRLAAAKEGDIAIAYCKVGFIAARRLGSIFIIGMLW